MTNAKRMAKQSVEERRLDIRIETPVDVTLFRRFIPNEEGLKERAAVHGR